MEDVSIIGEDPEVSLEKYTYEPFSSCCDGTHARSIVHGGYFPRADVRADKISRFTERGTQRTGKICRVTEDGDFVTEKFSSTPRASHGFPGGGFAQIAREGGEKGTRE